jgi:predicted nucleic acid-binding protein
MVAALISPSGASRQLLLACLDRQAELLLSPPLMIEYESDLTRPNHLARAGLGFSEVMEILDDLARICVPVIFDYRWRPTGANADDEFVLETAINGQADAIATFNLRHMRSAASEFGIKAENPGPLVRLVRDEQQHR